MIEPLDGDVRAFGKTWRRDFQQGHKRNRDNERNRCVGHDASQECLGSCFYLILTPSLEVMEKLTQGKDRQNALREVKFMSYRTRNSCFPHSLIPVRCQ